MGIMWYGLFTIVTTLSCLFTDRINIIMTLANTFLYIIVFTFLIKSKESVYFFFFSMCTIGLGLFTFLLFKYYSILGFGRLGNYMEGTTYESSILFSYVIIAVLCSTFVFMSINRTKILNIVAIICIAVSFTIAIFNGAKKGYMMPITYMLLYTFLKDRQNFFRLVFKMSLVIILIAIVWYTLKDVELLQRYFVNRIEGMIVAFTQGSNFDEDGSTSERLSYIPIALSAFADNPLFGMGGIGEAVPYFLHKIRVSHPHNDFLYMLASGGIILFAIFYWFPFSVLRKAYKTITIDPTIIGMLTLTATLLFNNFNSSTYNIPIINIFYVIVSQYVYYNIVYEK